MTATLTTEPRPSPTGRPTRTAALAAGPHGRLAAAGVRTRVLARLLAGAR